MDTNILLILRKGRPSEEYSSYRPIALLDPCYNIRACASRPYFKGPNWWLETAEYYSIWCNIESQSCRSLPRCWEGFQQSQMVIFTECPLKIESRGQFHEMDCSLIWSLSCFHHFKWLKISHVFSWVRHLPGLPNLYSSSIRCDPQVADINIGPQQHTSPFMWTTRCSF